MRTMTIRRLTDDDADDWARLRWEALTTHPLAFGASPPPDPASLVENFRQRIEPVEEGAIFGAVDNGTLVGVVGIARVPRDKERHKAFIWGMYVSPAHRARGVAARLMSAAVDHGRTWSDIVQVQLTVSEVAI